MTVLLELPVPVIQRTDLSSLEPPGDAMEVEGVVAHASSHGALLGSGRRLVGLALDTEVHDAVSADGAVVDGPTPRGDCVPLLHIEPLLFSSRRARGRRRALRPLIDKRFFRV